MSSDATAHIFLDESVVALLACPACHAELRMEATRLLCAGCGRAYPVVEDIPVLIADRAETGTRS